MDFNKLILARPLVAENLRKDFAAFCRAAWPHLHRGSRLSWTPAHDLISEYLMMVWEKKLLRLIVNCPPRFSKSSICTIFFPVWVWLQDPTLAFLCCSYEIDLATNHNLDRRRLMETKWFRDLFADRFQLATDRSLAGEFSNTAGGLMQAASTNSKAQGRGGHILIVDDPLSADAAYSEVFRNETNSWFVHQLPQRLNDPATSAIILVQQRLHQNDPTGFLLGQADSEWFLLKLALVAEQDETWTFPISGRVWTRRKGDCLDPKRWLPKVVRERQRDRLTWASQFQQSPMDPSGNMIRVDDICYYGGRDPKTGVLDSGSPETFDRKIISVDAAFKDRPANDYVCVIVIGIAGSRRYILHITNAHLDLTGTENEIRNCHANFAPISATLIEDKANGSAVISRLTEQIPGMIAVDPRGGKMTRVAATAPEFQARNWYVERNGPWTHKVIEQVTMFPNCKNDDICDCITQASVWLQQNTYDTGGLAEWARRDAAGLWDEARRLRRLVEKKILSRNGAVNAPGVIPSSCQHCGSTDLESCGTGPSTRFLCRTCGKYSEGELFKYSCPRCKSKLTTAIAAGQRRCGQCGFQFLPGVEYKAEEELGCAPRCPKFLPQPAGGRIKCGNCGRYHTAAPAAIGMSRAAYASRDPIGRQFGRFWN